MLEILALIDVIAADFDCYLMPFRRSKEAAPHGQMLTVGQPPEHSRYSASLLLPDYYRRLR